jgi:hypothetical protein
MRRATPNVLLDEYWDILPRAGAVSSLASRTGLAGRSIS